MPETVRKFWILILVWQATSYKQERKGRNKGKWILEFSQGQREIGGRPVLFSLAPTGEALYPLSIVYVWCTNHVSIHVCFLFHCLNDCFVVWMTDCFMFHVESAGCLNLHSKKRCGWEPSTAEKALLRADYKRSS